MFAEPGATPTERPTILVVEDDLGYRQLLLEELEDAGYVLTGVADAAAEILRRADPVARGLHQVRGEFGEPSLPIARHQLGPAEVLVAIAVGGHPAREGVGEIQVQPAVAGFPGAAAEPAGGVPAIMQRTDR